jgi:hypothetical protein
MVRRLLILNRTGSVEDQVQVNCDQVVYLSPIRSGGTRVHFSGHRDNYIEVVESPEDVARNIATVAMLDEMEQDEREAARAARERAVGGEDGVRRP